MKIITSPLAKLGGKFPLVTPPPWRGPYRRESPFISWNEEPWPLWVIFCFVFLSVYKNTKQKIKAWTSPPPLYFFLILEKKIKGLVFFLAGRTPFFCLATPSHYWFLEPAQKISFLKTSPEGTYFIFIKKIYFFYKNVDGTLPAPPGKLNHHHRSKYYDKQ